MSWWNTATLCLLLASCVASTEVKQASSQIGVSLTALREAQADLRDAYLRELEETRQMVGRAIVADAVVRKVHQMSKEELDGDLIAISSAINSEREAYRSLVDKILEAEPRANESDSAVVNRVLKGRADDLRKSAADLEGFGATESAQELRDLAVQLESGKDGVDQYDDMLVLVTLALTKEAVRTGIADLDQYVRYLQLVHAQVHEWITTDVTVKGDDVAALLERADALAKRPNGGGQ